MPTILKEKVHIINKKEKVISYLKSANKDMSLEVGMGNKLVHPTPSNEIVVMRISNLDNLGLEVRLTKTGKVNDSSGELIKLGPKERYNGVEILIRGENAGSQALEASRYWSEMLQATFQNSLMKNKGA